MRSKFSGERQAEAANGGSHSPGRKAWRAAFARAAKPGAKTARSLAAAAQTTPAQEIPCAGV